ncbi:putative protein [Arabidopsis thaliana]|uniref:Uncharacterized protein AT4g20710 n=1 Tax=Arabidopsis thaliana TaxID=3702 RepID=Q9SVH6_ARATH|nr:putative protein [Arabidopsis thaliana]CAB79071.1 putative protein [Arabidopsis thaliana]
MFQCRGDSYWSKCPPCISTAVSGISSVASFNKIDYENDFYLSNPNNMSDRGLFNKETSALLEKLAYKASDRNNLDGKQLVLYAAGEKRIGTKKAIAEWDRLTYLYERCVRSLSVEATNAKDAHEALAVEKEKVAQALADLARSQDDAKEMKRKYDELAGRALSEMKRLRERRLEYAQFVRRSALDKMASSFRSDWIAAEPKFFEFNQVSGNIKTLEALVEGGEVEMKSDDTMLRLVADAEELEAEVKAFGITDLMDGDFDVRTLFAELSPDNRNSVPPPTEGEDLADGRGECEGQAGERIVGQTEVRDEIADARD